MISEEKTFLASIGKEYPFPYFCPPGRSEIACWEVSQTLYENEERKTMNGRKRTVQVKFYVTEEERSLIEEKMKLVPTNNMAAYLRKIAIAELNICRFIAAPERGYEHLIVCLVRVFDIVKGFA